MLSASSIEMAPARGVTRVVIGPENARRLVVRASIVVQALGADGYRRECAVIEVRRPVPCGHAPHHVVTNTARVARAAG